MTIAPRRWCAATVMVATVSLFGAVAVSDAAEPKPGKYTGPAEGTFDPDVPDPTIELRVFSDGRKLRFRGPFEHCGAFNPLSKFFPSIESIKIKRDGSFDRKRDYEIKSSGVRGEQHGLTFVWTVKVSGRFVSAERAKGKLKYELRLRMRDPQTGEARPDYSCGRRSGSWSAKR